MAEQDVLPGALDGVTDLAISLLAERLYDPAKLSRVEKVIQNGVAKGQVIASGAQTEGILGLAADAAGLVKRGEDLIEALVAPLVVLIVSHMLGIEVTADQLRRAGKEGAGGPIGQAVAGTMMKALGGPEGELEPGDGRARDFLAMLANFTLQSWFEGIVIEHVVSVIPGQEPIEEAAKLAKNLIGAMGLNRLARVALRPLAQVTIATPLDWKVQKAYRPTLLGPSAVLRQFTRGRWDWADVEEELARQGYSSERIDALLNEQAKFLSAADAAKLIYRGEWTNEQGLQHLREQGYDQDAAERALRMEGIRQIEQLEAAEASALINAYASRDIDRADFESAVDAAIKPVAERVFTKELGEKKRALNVKFLSPVEVEACVRAQILNVIDYRRALERAGYTDDAIVAKELLLRLELDREKALEKHRAELEASRAAEKQARDDERAQRLADAEQARELQRRGPIADLRRAVARGLIPIARLTEVLAPQFDTDTVDILVALAEDDRQAYLAQQQQAEAARQRAAHRNLDIGALEQAVLSDTLTLDEFARHPALALLDPADRAVLVATLTARKKDVDDARAKRRAAEEAAKRRSIDLGRFEQLVRRGVRTLAQYEAVLASLDFDEPSRAAMVELLQLKIADDQAAADARRAVGAADAQRGLTLEQTRRAVLLGVATVDQFQTFLVAERYTADAQAVLVAELRDDVAVADAARARRMAVDAGRASPALPLATLRRAVQLGVLTPAAYQAALQRRGYSADDLAIELDLLVTELAAQKGGPVVDDGGAAAASPRDLSLAQLEQAVKAGLRSVDDYRADVRALGYDVEDAEILVALLVEKLGAAGAGGP